MCILIHADICRCQYRAMQNGQQNTLKTSPTPKPIYRKVL